MPQLSFGSGTGDPLELGEAEGFWSSEGTPLALGDAGEFACGPLQAAMDSISTTAAPSFRTRRA
ncbi:MAG TPA: hypothetical protein VGJ79_14315 [Candidatus Dormibacteraeota bacterium]